MEAHGLSDYEHVHRTYEPAPFSAAAKSCLMARASFCAKTAIDPHRQQVISVYREEPRSFSIGDRIQFTAPADDLRIANRELGTIERITESRMSLLMDDGRTVQLDPARHPHLDHG